jgi:ribose transport system ATP-binding protein
VTALLSLEGVSKTFAGTTVLSDVSLEILPGEVHALVGKNGSGKSTLAKVLSGFHTPDPGASGTLLDRELSFPLTGVEDRKMLHFVHQDLGLVDTLSIIDNIGLSDSYQVNRFGKIDWKHSRQRAQRALAPFGLQHLDLNLPVGQLTASERAITAIARGFLGWGDRPGVLVLDETTAALPPHEVEVLARAMRSVCARGAGILYITHRLDEVFSLADRVSVLRDGELVGVRATNDLTQEQLVGLMIGGVRADGKVARADVREEVVLKVEGLNAPGLIDVNLEIHGSEIVGIAGLLGSGRERIADVLYGASKLTSGKIFLDGKPISRATPHRSLERGVVLVPSDRAHRGIFRALSVRENITLARLGPLCRFGRISRRLEYAETNRWIDLVEVVPKLPDVPIATLSGGNQQKAVIARALRFRPRVLILDEATQGVDVGAKRAIHNLIRRAAARGTAVIVCTAEAEDLPALCHRAVVMRSGRIAEELSGSDLTQERLLVSCSQEG